MFTMSGFSVATQRTACTHTSISYLCTVQRAPLPVLILSAAVAAAAAADADGALATGNAFSSSSIRNKSFQIEHEARREPCDGARHGMTVPWVGDGRRRENPALSRRHRRRIN